MIKLFIVLLTTLFVGLKLGGVISWGWALVLVPVWGLPALMVAFLIALLLGGIVSVCIGRHVAYNAFIERLNHGLKTIAE